MNIILAQLSGPRPAGHMRTSMNARQIVNKGNSEHSGTVWCLNLRIDNSCQWKDRLPWLCTWVAWRQSNYGANYVNSCM